ncbi:hypothetical protein ABCS02_20615 [Microbacterium sp. X-17]|uniref:hypothetical protein n=1 Tax=Microbacterium sp. X-17 TaxID=3144404 RepID=UPI0031F58BD4
MSVQGLPAYPVGAAGTERVNAPTGTVWIWLNVLLPVVTLPSLFLLNTSAYLRATFEAAATGHRQVANAATASYLAGSLAVWGISLVVIGLCVLFAWLDWRELRRRGIPRPFAWPWAFFAFLNNGVYVIGRGVVLRRRTGHGLGPIWGWAAVTALSVIVGVVYGVAILTQTFELIRSTAGVLPR